MELNELLEKLKDTNSLIDPVEVIKLIEAVGGWIDDLDLEIIVLEEQVNILWHSYQSEVKRTNAEVNNLVKVSVEYKNFRERTALLKRLRRHYRLLNTKLNLITKPKGR